jgi:hypothetical protein
VDPDDVELASGGARAGQPSGGALPLPWPPVVEWQVSGQLRRSAHQGRLELAAPSSLMVFASTGRLVATASFAAADDAARPLRLARGSYDLVGPAGFFGPDEIESAPVPGGQHLRIELGDMPLTLVRAGRALTLAPVQRPELELFGTALRDLHGRAIYSEQAFGVRVRWPPSEDEPEGGPDEVPHGPRMAHALLLEIADKELPPLPLGCGPAGEAMVDLGPHLAEVKPVLRRVVLKLVRRGERRPLARAATFVWVGLQPGNGHLFIGRRPANLVAAACTHFRIADDQVALTADRSYAAARLVVDEVDGRHRREAFEFAYPGVLAVLRWLDPEGGRREQVLERDHVVARRPGDPRLIEVSCPDPAATLIIGAQRRPGAFMHRPRVGIPLAMAADACRAGADQLAVRGADGIEIPLVRFTVPCEVVRWHEDADGARDERTLLLGFREPLDGLRLRARDLWHDRVARLELAPDGLRRRDAGGITLRLEPDHSGPESRARLVAELDDWPEGLWLCELEAKLGDDPRWQALSNMRGDTFAWLVPHRLGGILKGDLTGTLPFAARVRIFAHCHKQLQRCFAPPCWEAGIRQILGLWRGLAASLAGDPRLDPSWPALLLLAFVDPPIDASESWLPLVSFWDVLPRFMSLPGRNYAHLRQLERDDTTVLALLADLASAGSVARLLQQRDALDVAFFGCFTNLGAVDRAQGEVECRGFNFRSYLDRLQSACEDGEMAAWSPVEPALSTSHYLSAFEGLLRRYHVLTAGQGNAQRVPSASRLALDARRWLDREGRDLAEAAIPGLSVGDAWMALPLPIDEEADALLHTAPNALAAIALACRLEARRPGALDAFMADLADGDRDLGKVTADVHFLTVAGRDLFAFWMLFWDVLLTTGE